MRTEPQRASRHNNSPLGNQWMQKKTKNPALFSNSGNLSSSLPVAEREAIRIRLQRDVERYLANGGKVSTVPVAW